MQSGYNAHSFTDADRRKRIYIRMLVRCPPTWRLATVAKEVGQLIGFVQRVYSDDDDGILEVGPSRCFGRTDRSRFGQTKGPWKRPCEVRLQS